MLIFSRLGVDLGIKIPPKIKKVGVRNGLKSVPGALWEGSGGHLGPKMTPRRPQERKNNPKTNVLRPKMAPIFEPKSINFDIF